MKGPHVLVQQLVTLSHSVEQEFFRIERESRWLAAIINALIAGIAVALVAWMFDESQLLLFACLGSSAASVVFAPLAKANSLRSIIISYAAAVLVSLVLLPLHDNQLAPIAVQCFLAVTLTVFLTRMLDALHPAAIGSAMAFIIYDRDGSSLLMLMFAIIALLAIVKILAYVYLEELEFRNFHLEFRRRYYGREMLVTVKPDEEAPPTSTSERGIPTGDV